MEQAFIPYIQTRANALVCYSVPDPPFRHRRHDLARYATYSGTVTDSTYQRIRRTVDVFLQKSPKRTISNPVTGSSMPFRLNFVTLTIAQAKPVSARDGHTALKVFLQHFKRPPGKKPISEQLKSYLWKCELQERGQLHYHITTNSFLHLGEVRRVWNGIQFRRGWLADFIAREGHTNPNSTDVHAVYKVRDIGAYLSKYLAKTGRKDLSEYGFPGIIYEPKIDGKVWDCSNDLKVKRFSIELDSTTETNIRTAIKFRRVQRVDLERCTILRTDDPRKLLSVQAAAAYDAWL